MIVALFPNPRKKSTHHYAISISEFLRERQVKVVADDGEALLLNADPLSSVDIKSINFAISMGGDGTILRLLHSHPELEAPVIGINMGSLGFLADIPLSEIYPSLQNILDGSYEIQNRMMMEGVSGGNEHCYAVNDVVVHRAQNPSLIELGIYVDGIYLNTFAADGIIVATPSGSTAYSLAAGGPILTPDLEAFVITPISPHTISNRPVVLMPKKEIRIVYLSDHKPVEVAFDGITTFHLQTNEECVIRKADRKFPLVSLPHHDYFATLRTKLGWTGMLYPFPSK